MHVRLLRPPKIQAKANRYSYKIQIQQQAELAKRFLVWQQLVAANIQLYTRSLCRPFW